MNVGPVDRILAKENCGRVSPACCPSRPLIRRRPALNPGATGDQLLDEAAVPSSQDPQGQPQHSRQADERARPSRVIHHAGCSRLAGDVSPRSSTAVSHTVEPDRAFREWVRVRGRACYVSFCLAVPGCFQCSSTRPHGLFALLSRVPVSRPCSPTGDRGDGKSQVGFTASYPTGHVVG